MNENEFELDGKVYVAVEHDNSGACIECSFSGSVMCMDDKIKCIPTMRTDMRNVIFVEKPQ